MLTRVVGIDPGLDGALAVLDLHQGGAVLHVTRVTPTPTLTVTVRKRRRREYDIPGMWRLVIDAIAPAAVRIAVVAVEHQGPRPKEGVVSSFRTGLGFGLWRGLIVAAQLPLAIVTPQAWRREYGLLGAGKHASIRCAVERFPTYPSTLTRHDGAADAILIAGFAARRHALPTVPDASQPSDPAPAAALPSPTDTPPSRVPTA